jgi:hypothetical protein
VNPAIGVRHLSRHEARDIFLGHYRTFPSGTAALPIDLATDSTERTQFYLTLANMKSSDLNAYWAHETFTGKLSPPMPVRDAAAAVGLVATNLNAIAYVYREDITNTVHVALELTP